MEQQGGEGRKSEIVIAETNICARLLQLHLGLLEMLASGHSPITSWGQNTPDEGFIFPSNSLH